MIRTLLALLATTFAVPNVLAAQKPTFKLLVLERQMVRWTSARVGGPVEISWAFTPENTDSPAARNCRRMRPLDTLAHGSNLAVSRVEDEIRAAFRLWESAADIRFVETTDWRGAGILVGAQESPEGLAFADVQPRSETEPGVIGRSLVCFNPAQRWKIGFDGDLGVLDIRFTAAHEIGHAIGLDHPSRSGELMSFRYDERFRDLQPGDIAGAAALYGAPGGGPFRRQVPGNAPSTLAITGPDEPRH